MLSSYSENIIKAGGVEYFRKKYPGLTQDAIAEKLCTLAMRYAAIAGGVTGITASTGVLGGLTIPVIIAAIGGEILYTTRLQVRLIYDLATVYGDPIDFEMTGTTFIKSIYVGIWYFCCFCECQVL